MEPKSYSPSTAAKAANVHPNTIRGWTEQYAEFLSPGSQERPRRYTPADVAVFQAIEDMRRQAIEIDEILQRLRQIPEADLQQPSIETASVAPETTKTGSAEVFDLEAATGASPAILAVRELASVATSRIDDVNRRLDSLEKQRSNTWFAIVGFALGAGVVLIAILIVLMLLRTQ